MKYKLFSTPPSQYVPSITGALLSPKPPQLVAWQPSTWPLTPAAVDDSFVTNLKQIFEESILGEIHNVIDDATRSNGDLQHRGHVIALALMCATDAIASYGYRGKHVQVFVTNHFPVEYQKFSARIYNDFRLDLVHRWNLFAAAIYPDNSGIREENGILVFGLLNYFEALVAATEDFLDNLARNTALQSSTLERYEELRSSAK
jgi:hypothetical protein